MMLKISRKKKIILAGLCAFGINFVAVEIPTAQAVYKSRSDTGTEAFDYIENQRRERRAKELTEEQKKFIEDMEETRQRLPRPISPDEPIPAAFEGDDLTYNTLTGEFIAKGHVDIIQLDGHRFQSSDASGNVNTQDIRVKGKAHVLQFNENSPRVSLDGYNTFYNYGTKQGTMDNVKGKAGEYYIYGKRFEFYPDHIVAYDAYQTKCGAKYPDYKVSAKRMEIWPEQIIRMYDIQLWIGEVVVGAKKYDERKLESNSEPYFPRAGYNSTNGFYVEDTFTFPVINNHFEAVINAHIDTKNQIRSNTEFHYNNRNVAARVLYGYYYDGDGRWIKKEPSLNLYYGKRFKTLPLSYSFEYEVGKWGVNNISSTHEDFVIGLRHDPITLWEKYTLYLNTNYRITKDDAKRPSRFKQNVRGLNYGISIFREFDDNFAAYAGYFYTKNTSQNSLYDFDTDSYSNKFATGVSYRFTDKDRFVVGLSFDTKNGTLQDVDYYWYRDLHCSTAILRWRAKRDELEARWQFTPW